MKKRILCVCLSFCLLLGSLVLPMEIHAASSMTSSEDLVEIIKKYEGFSGTPYMDTDGKYTIGYGTRCPDELVDQYNETPMTEAEAEVELRKELVTYEDAVNDFIDEHGLSYKQCQFDAVVSLVFNVGPAWLNKGETLINALAGGAQGNDLIYALTIYSMSGGQRSKGHILRRLSESCIYLEGIYSRPAPERYCYVLYDAQGGTISAKGGTYNVQGYNGELTAAPVATASRDGYTFQGWYTEASGGTKVNVLDMTHNAMTLYAHWGTEEEAPHKHSYTASKVPATCTAGGYTVHTCDCGDSYQDSYTDPLPHDYVDGTCTDCGGVRRDVPQIEYCYSQRQTSVRVKWTKVDGADGYQLYRTTDPDDSGSWKCVKTITSGDTLTYTNQGLTEGVTYYYKVRSFSEDSSGRTYSKFSEVSHMPGAVVFDSPYSNSSTQIRVRWHAVEGSHGYQIWRKEEGGSYRIVKTIGDKGNTLTNDRGDVTYYTNSGLTAGKRYTYKMRAFYITEDGTKVFGTYSDEVTVAAQPIAPTLDGSSTRSQRASLQWDAVEGADGYQIWMTDTLDDGFHITKTITGGDVTSYTKTGLTSGTTYYFRIRAYVEEDGRKAFGAYSQTIALWIK